MQVKPFTYTGDLDRQNLMADIVVKYSVHPKIRQLALNIVKPCKDYDFKCEIYRVFDWVKRNIRYRNDIAYIETFQSPLRTIELRAGDCDDFTILTDTLLMSLGWTVGSKIIEQQRGKGFSHIYSVVFYPKNITLDIVGNKAILPPNAKVVPLDASSKFLGCCQEVAHYRERVFVYLPKHALPT